MMASFNSKILSCLGDGGNDRKRPFMKELITNSVHKPLESP